MQDWRRSNVLDPLKLGWQLAKLVITPIEMNNHLTPPELLKTVRCDFKTKCLRKNCTRRQHQVVCTNICLDCSGVSRMNCEPINDSDP